MSDQKDVLTEKCMNCKDLVTNYTILELIEVIASNAVGKNADEMEWDFATLCINCWSNIKKNSNFA